MAKASMRAVVHGRVQGVFFRASVTELANNLDLTGYVRNLPSGADVEVQAEGEKTGLDRLAEFLRVGPPNAEVENVLITWGKYTGNYAAFKART